MRILAANPDAKIAVKLLNEIVMFVGLMPPSFVLQCMNALWHASHFLADMHRLLLMSVTVIFKKWHMQ
jgi:hypothetical protein